MPDQYRSGDKFHDISAIDSRLADLEQEKQQLIALRAALQKSEPVPVGPQNLSAQKNNELGFIWITGNGARAYLKLLGPSGTL